MVLLCGALFFDMCDEAPQRLKAKDLEKLAAERLAALRAAGDEVHPVVNKTRQLASHFWGRAWMQQLAHCESGGLCLAPGRTLLRHGCVLDVRIEPGHIAARVSADSLYEVSLRVTPPEIERTEALRHVCVGQIDSLVSLLSGKINEDVMQHLCHPNGGLLPDANDWHMFCSCADWSEPCPHAAAAMYAAGVLIDENPSLLFLLREVDVSEWVAAPSLTSQPFDVSSLSSTFGIDIEI